MATITTLNSNDNGAISRVTINTNFSNLNSAKIETLADLGISATSTQINYLVGVTSAIQTQLNSKQSTITNLAVNLGGTGITSYSVGDILYASGATTLSKLSIAVDGSVLKLSGGLPTWAVVSGTGTVTSVSVVSANGISGTVATPTTTPAITLSLGAITPTSVNGLTLSSQAIGFTIAGGTTSKTLTVPLDASVSGSNTGDQNLSGLVPYTGATGNVNLGAYNLTDNNIINGYATTVTAAGTTTLTVSSAREQFFTGVTTQTVVLPNATTLALGFQFRIHNNSTGLVTVNANGGGGVWILGSNSDILITATDISTAAGVWDVHYLATGIASGKKLSFANSLLFSGTDNSALTLTTNLTNNGGAGTLTWPAAGATLTIPTGGGTLGTNAFSSTAYLPLAGGTLTGNLLFTDNTLDIGASGLTRPRTGYFGTSVVAPVVNGTTGFQINGAAVANKILKGNGTNFVASTETYAAPGTSGNVMTSDGTNWTSAAPSGGTPKLTMSANFDASGRYNVVNGGSGSTTFGVNGAYMTTGATATSYTLNEWILSQSTSGNFISGSPTISMGVSFGTMGSDFKAYWGIGIENMSISGSNITYTANHIGFKADRSAGGVMNLYATQADGTTETASASLTTFVATDVLDLIITINSTTSTSYYWRKNGGALSSATTLSTNMPISNSYVIGGAVSNVGVATASYLYMNSVSYSR